MREHPRALRAHSFGTCVENTQLEVSPPKKEGRKESSQGVGDLVRADARNNTHLVNVTQPTHSENKHLNFLAALQTFNTVPTRAHAHAHAHAHTHAGLCIF